MIRAALVLAICLWTTTARAECPEGFICLPIAAHQAILADLLELRGNPDDEKSTGLRGRVTLLDEQLTLKTKQIVDLTLAKALAVQAETVAKDSLGAAVAGKREAEASRDAWHRSRSLWLTIGTVVGIAITIVAAKVVKDTQQ